MNGGSWGSRMEPRLNAPPALNIEALAKLGELLEQTPKASGVTRDRAATVLVAGQR
jgi:hypothetical protein